MTETRSKVLDSPKIAAQRVAFRAIQDSRERDAIITISAPPSVDATQLKAQLAALADEWTDTETMYEFWGATWRVHLLK